MKTFFSILTLGVIVGAFIAGFFYGRFKPVPPVPQQLTLEKVLSIKELHLVRHTYTDLFFLHKNNDPRKAIRAIVQVPVEIAAYLDLRKIEVVKSGDTIRQLLLPRAVLREPQYQVEKMMLRETRSWQFQVGKDLYPQVGQFIQSAIAVRMDSVRQMAVANRILAQAEEEGKEYILSALRELHHAHIAVRFVDEVSPTGETVCLPGPGTRNAAAHIQVIPFGALRLK